MFSLNPRHPKKQAEPAFIPTAPTLEERAQQVRLSTRPKAQRAETHLNPRGSNRTASARGVKGHELMAI